MKCINNPALLAGFPAVSVDCVMAHSAKRGKQTVVAKPTSRSASLMMDILTLGFLASLANRVERQVSLLYLCILFVFILALGGCIPQPSAALKWSF